MNSTEGASRKCWEFGIKEQVSVSCLSALLLLGVGCSGGDSGGDDGSSGGDGGGGDAGGGTTTDNAAFSSSGTLAFATAEGFGRKAAGGRGGSVIKVTNLNDSGSGSLRAAVEQSGVRTVVFDVAGTIQLNSPMAIRDGRITIAGQTAPGDGITLQHHPLIIDGDDVIVRYIRCRPGSKGGGDPNSIDAVSVNRGSRIIVDHVSASWSIDECLSVTGTSTDQVTIQWCIISEGLNDAGHSSGKHSRGTLISGANGARYSFHHNLYAHQDKRMPEIRALSSASSDPDGLLVDVRNNVFHNWGGDEAGLNVTSGDGIARYNFVKNYYQGGIDTDPFISDSFPFVEDPRIFDEQSSGGEGYFNGNWFDGKPIGDNYDQVELGSAVNSSRYRSTSQHSTSGFSVKTQATDDAFEAVTDSAGASLSRDQVDDRVIAEVMGDLGSIIGDESEVGGHPTLASGSNPTDSDGDGMPDSWESEKGLSSTSQDHNGLGLGDGRYTNLEHYLAERAGEVLP